MAAALGGGCGGGDDRPEGAGRAAGPARFLDGPALERGLGSTFRRGLYRLAVMTQAGDDAPDLGQPLPTGVVDATTCRTARPAGPGRTARCVVRWETVEHRRRTTAYAVDLSRAGCFYAQADPALRQIHDATIRAPAEHPLQSLVAAVKGC